VASIVSYLGAGLLLILSLLGFVHERRTSPEADLMPTAARAEASTG
jgi:hypothetical protein